MLLKEMLNNSSLNYQLMKSEKSDFHFLIKTNGLTPSVLVAHPCATGSTELISASLKIATYSLKE
jgi:hypothetical protein